MVTVKSVLCLLKIYTNYKLPGFRIKFLKLKFWKLLSNSSATFNLERVNLLSNANVERGNGIAYKKNPVFFWSVFSRIPSEYGNIQSKSPYLV